MFSPKWRKNLYYSTLEKQKFLSKFTLFYGEKSSRCTSSMYASKTSATFRHSRQHPQGTWVAHVHHPHTRLTTTSASRRQGIGVGRIPTTSRTPTDIWPGSIGMKGICHRKNRTKNKKNYQNIRKTKTRNSCKTN